VSTSTGLLKNRKKETENQVQEEKRMKESEQSRQARQAWVPYRVRSFGVEVSKAKIATPVKERRRFMPPTRPFTTSKIKALPLGYTTYKSCQV